MEGGKQKLNSWNNSFNNSFASMQQLNIQTGKNITTIKNITNSILIILKNLYTTLKTELKNLKTAIDAQNRKVCFVKFNDHFKKQHVTLKLSIKCASPNNNGDKLNNKNQKSWLEKINEWLELVNNILDIGNSILDIINGIRDLFKSDKPSKPKKENKNKREPDRKSNKNKNKSNKKSNKSNKKSFKSQKLKNPKNWLTQIRKLGSSATKGKKAVTSKVGNLLTSGAARKGAMKAVTKAAPKVLMRALPWVARGAAKFVPGVGLLSLGYDAYSLYKYIKKKNEKNTPAPTNKISPANERNYDAGTQFSNTNTMTYPAIANKNQAGKKKKSECSQTGFRDFNIAKIADTVVIREEADINRIAKIIAAKLESAKNNQGGRVNNGNLAKA